MMVKDLRPRNKVDSIELVIVEKGDPRSYTSREGLTGQVCDAQGKDDDGDTVAVTLWNDDIDRVDLNDRVSITNGWVSEWQGTMQVSAGRYGTLEVVK